MPASRFPELIMNPWFFLEATGEVYQGTSGVFESHERSQVSWLGRLRGYHDITESTNLDIGASFAWGHNDIGPDSTTRLVRCRRHDPVSAAAARDLPPLPRAAPSCSGAGANSSTLRFRRSACMRAATTSSRGAGSSGLRYDWSERADDSSLVDKGPSFVVTFWPSEFSQIRGQYRRLRYAEGSTANEVLFQFLFSIGAHGAHAF